VLNIQTLTIIKRRNQYTWIDHIKKTNAEYSTVVKSRFFKTY